MKHNRQFDEKNDRIKRAYLKYLRMAKGLAETSVNKVAEAILRLEKATNYKPFSSLTISDAESFREDLEQLLSVKTGKKVLLITRVNTLVQVRAFIHWLADQPGYKSSIRHSFADHFSPSRKEKAIAHSERPIPSAAAEQAMHAFRQMPSETTVERRDRALFALMMLTGARIQATCSLKLGHVDLAEGCVRQDAVDVETKFSKTFTTWFMPVAQEFDDCLRGWIGELRRDLLFGPRDPLFPKQKVKVTPDGYQPDGFDRSHYSSDETLRKIIKSAFSNAGLPPFTPHRFRNTLVEMCNDLITTPEELKAISMNIGHSSIETTVDDYGRVSPRRQGEVMKRLRAKALGRKSPGWVDD